MYVRNMGLSQGRAVNIVKAKFKLDRVKEARKTLFKDVAIEERDLNKVCLNSTETKGRGGFKSWSGGVCVWGGDHWPSVFAI